MKTFPFSAQHTHKEYCVFTLLSSKTGHKREGISIFWHNVHILPLFHYPYTPQCTTCRLLSNDIVTVNGHSSGCQKLDVIANQSADWCGNPLQRSAQYRKRTHFGNLQGIATPVCALARNDIRYSIHIDKLRFTPTEKNQPRRFRGWAERRSLIRDDCGAAREPCP